MDIISRINSILVSISGSQVVPSCVVCPIKGGILMRTKCKQFCHAACALWIPEVSADVSSSNPKSALVDVGHIPKVRVTDSRWN